jgi:predicted transcriptional regulator
MGRPRHDVTEAELQVLQALWDQGPATVRQLTDRLYPGGGASAYATVQKLLERLEHKGGVSRRRGEAAQVFEAATTKDDLIARRLRAVAEQLCGGSLTPILTNLVRTGSLSVAERRELRALLEELTQVGKGKKYSSRE